MNSNNVYILSIESSCDETSAAVVCNNVVLSNVIANQDVHQKYGGVVPELASRAHQSNIVPVVNQAIKISGISKSQLHAIAFTRGPGLIGSLMVGVSFAKSFALALNVRLIEVNHMEAHVLANFALQKNEKREIPQFPFLCLTVSGGHTQIVMVESHLKMHIIGQTLDDAAGEAFDKIAKTLEVPYPGGPLIDKMAATGNEKAFRFPHPQIPDLNFSFSGLKTAVMYFINENTKKDAFFLNTRKNDLCASVQKTIVDILISKLKKAVNQTGIKHVAVAGGVSANSGLRGQLKKTADELGWNIYIPAISLCTDNAAMIGTAAYYKYLEKEFATLEVAPLARMAI